VRQMPTAAKLMAALSLAGVGFLAAKAFEHGSSEGPRGALFGQINAAIGLAVGWAVLGRAVGKGYSAALSAGFTAVFWLFFWSLSGFTIRETILRILNNRYPSPTDAMKGIVHISFYYFKLAISPEVIGVLVIGGLLSGVIAEFTSRRWK